MSLSTTLNSETEVTRINQYLNGTETNLTINCDLFMKSEALRLLTFCGKYWSPGTAATYARDGFYHASNGKAITCAFCQETKYKPSVMTEDVHKIHARQCLMWKGYYCGNLLLERCKLKDQVLEKMRETADAMGVPGWDREGGSTRATDGLAPFPTDPKWTDYEEYETRLRKNQEFSQVRPFISLGALSDAGFFYEPTAQELDKVVCFWCNGGMANFEPGDDPWTEHAMAFPGCSYVRQKRGTKFIYDLFKRNGIPTIHHGGDYNDAGTRFLFTPELFDVNTRHITIQPHHRNTYGWIDFDSCVEFGFYVNAQEQLVCYFCGYQLELNDLTVGKDPKQRHLESSPDCRGQ